MIKLPAEHVDVTGPVMKRIAGRVDADEGVAGLDPIQKPFGIGDGQIARGANEGDAVIMAQ